MTVLVSCDMKQGLFRRYRRGANGRAIFEEQIKVEPWMPVVKGEVEINPMAIEDFRRLSTEFAAAGPPEAA